MVEKVKLKGITKSRSNPYHVPQRQWRKWSPKAREVFNELFSTMVQNQYAFLHPQQDRISKRMWRTTAWNAAWIAADAAN